MINKNNIGKNLFWDVNLKNGGIRKNAYFIIGRILEYGDENDIRWMLKNFKISQIKKILSTKKIFRLKARNTGHLSLECLKIKFHV